MDTITKVESKETFEVVEPTTKIEVVTPTREELKEKGWSAKELESAEKRGMITPPKKKEEPKSEDKPEVKPEAIEKPIEPTPEAKPKSSIPDFTFKTPEQEKAFLDAFGTGTPQRAMYFRMKNERQARQAAEADRDKERQSREALEARIKALETKPADDLNLDGETVDPDDKPLTLNQLRELQKQEAEAIEKKKAEMNQRASVVAEAQQTQEEYARSIYPDFDDTVKRAAEVMKNLDTLVPEKWKQAKAIKLIRDLQIAAANADKIDLDEYHAAHIAYEIGQMHPDYGKSADKEPTHGDASDKDGKSIDPKKANGGRLTPEQMKRIEENTQRRASSASVSGGGGSRTISSEDVDLTTLNKMGYSERQRFREKHPTEYARLLRG